MTPSETDRDAYPVVAVVGPTGSGKSELGLFLARQLEGEIVSCDSVQVYRELHVGSAKLLPSQQAGVPHHLLDIAGFTEELTAGAYSRLARSAIFGIRSRGKLPIVVGGTGLYLRALFEGLSPAPARDPALREHLTAAERRHPGALYRLLRKVDPASAGRIHSRDVQKLIRALEIYSTARLRASAVQNGPRQAFTGIRLLKIGLNPNREELRERLDTRTEAMFRSGLMEETRALLDLVRSGEIPKSLGSLGYKQAVRVLRGELSVSQAIVETQGKTRQYSKRQMTWFRSDKSVIWIDDFGWKSFVQEDALLYCTQFLGDKPDRAVTPQ